MSSQKSGAQILLCEQSGETDGTTTNLKEKSKDNILGCTSNNSSSDHENKFEKSLVLGK